MRGAQGAALLHVAYVGVVNDLFEALSRRGPMTPSELAEEAGRSPGYVARWCDAAYAFELLDEVGEGRFEASPLGEAFRPSVEGSLMPMAVQTVLGAHMAERAAGLMVTGERPGEKVLAERETVLPWFGPMLEATFGPMFEQVVLPAVPAFEEVDERGGLAVDLGCGNGWYLRKLAGRESRLRGIGLDAFEPNIFDARRRAEAEGVSDRLSFRVGDLHSFAVDEPADLIAMNRALHHVWDEKENVFRILREHLKPGGFAVIWEPAWPASRAALREPAMRGMAFQNLAEHVQGNHFLRPDEIAAELERSGFDPEVYLVADEREAVVVGRKR
jgi:SAM-dependent methyltransferase